MTLLPSTIALLLCLLVATLLGAGIGACIWHLRLSRRHDRSLQHLHRAGTREREALNAMLAQEREAFVMKHEQQTRRLRQEHERAELAVARVDELARRENEQARRIEQLEANGAALDKRLSALRRRTDAERDFSLAGQHHSLGEELPILRRRVDGAMPSPDSKVLTLDGELVDGELEIPALAESELPDSVDDLLLELLDTGRASAVAAYDGVPDAHIDDPDATDPDVTGLHAGSTIGARDER